MPNTTSMKRKLEDDDEEDEEGKEEDEEDLELWSFPKIKAGSFALLMHNDDLKKREGFFLSLHDVFRSADEPCPSQDQERFFELCEGESPPTPPAKSSSPSRFRRSFRANTADSASSSSSALARKKKRSLMSDFLDSTFRKHSSLSDAPPSPTNAAPTTYAAPPSEPFGERLARLKARFFGAV